MRRDGCRDAWFREAEAPGQRPADALQLETVASDASVCARRDAAADVCQEVHSQQRRVDGAEKLVGRERGVRGRDDSPRSEPQAALAAVPAARGLCKPDGGQSGERSCAAPEATELPGEPPQVPLAKRSRWQPGALPQKEHARPESASQAALSPMAA